MDAADMANDMAQIERDCVLSAHRLAHPAATLVSAKWCVDPACGERIAEARRAAIPGVQRCVDCQAEHDKRLQQQRREGQR